MRLIIHTNYNEACVWIARYIAERINACTRRNFVLGLPTGSSPLGIYQELISLYHKGSVSFVNVTTFNMDEYVGLSVNHPQSYHRFMWDNFFSHIDIKTGNVNILNGTNMDIEAECTSYEDRIKAAGGIDLFLGGVGSDGHIAFNEPGSSLHSRTRIKTLTQDTKIANARFFDGNPKQVPSYALTVGVGTIMDAREVVIIVSGYNKARALQAAVEGSVSQMCTLSCLQLHPKSIIVCDEEATDELKVSTVRYFKEIEHDPLIIKNKI
ncbi:glucosamine-6-phosphate deaminase [Spirochaetia bacterium]|nr:glucosamine-6-phosphate deaminase [Spirochaetia bacterium]GHU33060.1 glucosamine-6-phosphate deaminase [Spirochaetia bacterium]